MVSDDGAPDGYNTRQRAGKGLSRGRREASGGQRGRRCPPVATLHRPDLPGEVRGYGRAWRRVRVLLHSSCKNG